MSYIPCALTTRRPSLCIINRVTQVDLPYTPDPCGLAYLEPSADVVPLKPVSTARRVAIFMAASRRLDVRPCATGGGMLNHVTSPRPEV
jgi:hypothetical protein